MHNKKCPLCKEGKIIVKKYADDTYSFYCSKCQLFGQHFYSEESLNKQYILLEKLNKENVKSNKKL